jgi:hypothetical protein
MNRNAKGQFAKKQLPETCIGWPISMLVVIVAALILGLALAINVAKGAEIKYPCPALESPRDPTLDAEAKAHAAYMARMCVQGHQGFESRFNRLSAKWPGSRIAEICFEAWPWQVGCTEAELWIEAAKCWRQSPGHWSVACRRHKLVGIGLAKGRNNTWYGCLISVDRKEGTDETRND